MWLLSPMTGKAFPIVCMLEELSCDCGLACRLLLLTTSFLKEEQAAVADCEVLFTENYREGIMRYIEPRNF
jgi:hypothetical protein